MGDGMLRGRVMLGNMGLTALVVAVVLGVCALTLVEVGTAIRIRR